MSCVPTVNACLLIIITYLVVNLLRRITGYYKANTLILFKRRFIKMVDSTLIKFSTRSVITA